MNFLTVKVNVLAAYSQNISFLGLYSGGPPQLTPLSRPSRRKRLQNWCGGPLGSNVSYFSFLSFIQEPAVMWKKDLLLASVHLGILCVEHVQAFL